MLCLQALMISAMAQATYFYPNSGPMNPAIPTPEQFLGYPLGSHHTRYDRMVAYFQELARISDKATFEVFGQSYEQRPLVALTITSTANHSRLEDIRQKHLQRNTSTAYDNEPLVVLLPMCMVTRHQAAKAPC